MKKVEESEVQADEQVKVEAVELDINEQQLIAQERERKNRLDKCNADVLKVLKKYEATLQINPRSPIGAPQIIVVLTS